MVACAYIDGVFHYIVVVGRGVYELRKDKEGDEDGWDVLHKGPLMMCEAMLDNLCDNAKEWE